MKLKTIVCAAAALCAAGAYAQSAVTITGYADAGIVMESGGAAGSVNKMGSGISGPSRLIFRGVEELGGGTNAQFHLEAGVLLGTGGSLQQNFFGRQSWLGLSGNWGSVRAGLQFTPLFGAMRDVVDPFRASYAGNAGSIMTAGAPGGPRSVGFPNTSAGNSRVATGGISRANMVQYNTPKMGGFTAELAHAFGEQVGDSGRLSTTGGSVGYAAGPMALRFAFSSTNNATDTATERNWLLGGNYNFGPARVHAGFGGNRNYAGAESSDALLGLSAKLGPGTVMASYIKRNDKSAVNNDASQIAVGYVYPLSKRTQLHFSVAKISNKVPNTSPAFITTSTPAGPGTGDRAIAFGIGHFF